MLLWTTLIIVGLALLVWPWLLAIHRKSNPRIRIPKYNETKVKALESYRYAQEAQSHGMSPHRFMWTFDLPTRVTGFLPQTTPETYRGATIHSIRIGNSEQLAIPDMPLELLTNIGTGLWLETIQTGVELSLVVTFTGKLMLQPLGQQVEEVKPPSLARRLLNMVTIRSQ